MEVKLEDCGIKDFIYMDPPWSYDISKNMMGMASDKYDCMDIDDISKINIKSIVSDNCIMLMWVTAPFFKKALELANNFNFLFAGVYACWNKLDKSNVPSRRILGFYTRIQMEYLFLFVKGEKTIESFKNMNTAILSTVRGEHSVKPNEMYEIINTQFINFRKIEIFSRKIKDINWDFWGNEVGKIEKQTFDLEEVKKIRKEQEKIGKMFQNSEISVFSGKKIEIFKQKQKKINFDTKKEKKEDIQQRELTKEEIKKIKEIKRIVNVNIESSDRKYGIIHIKLMDNITKKLKEINIKKICNNNCLLFIWTDPKNFKKTFKIAKEWKFDYVTVFMNWIKTNGKDEIYRNEEGFFENQNIEYMLLFKKGRGRYLKKIKQFWISNVIITQFDKNVIIPKESYQIIDKMFENVPKLDIYSGNIIYDENWDVCTIDNDDYEIYRNLKNLERFELKDIRKIQDNILKTINNSKFNNKKKYKDARYGLERLNQHDIRNYLNKEDENSEFSLKRKKHHEEDKKDNKKIKISEDHI